MQKLILWLVCFLSCIAARGQTSFTYRYWIDNDVEGIQEGNYEESLSLEIPVNGLSGWLHQLHFQVKDSRNVWSPVETRSFAVLSDEATRFNNGGQYRYWFDTDLDHLHTGTFTNNAVPIDIPVNDLSGWYHHLHLQVADNRGQWSAVITRPIAVNPDYTNRFNEITTYRYWIDDQELQTTTGTANGGVMALDIPVGELSATEHTLYLQVQDKLGRWSYPAAGTFTLTTSALTIMATGNGAVKYATDEFRDDVKDYEIVVGNLVALSMTPDEGYGVTRVIVNGTEDVTDQVVDNQLNLYATETMSVEVTFDLTDFTKLGDVNNDTRVSVADLSLSVDYLVGGHPSPFVLRQADANNDGDVNVADVVRIADLIIGAVERGSHAPARHRDAEECGGNVLTGQIQGSLLSFDLTNSAEYVAFQLSLTLPEGVERKDTRLLRGDNHVVASGIADDGELKMVVYSGDNSALQEQTGQLLQIQMVRPIEGDVLVNDIVFVTRQGQIHKFAPIRVSGTTGIAATSEAGARQQAFDLNGRPVLAKPKRGIYIIGGKKIIFK